MHLLVFVFLEIPNNFLFLLDDVLVEQGCNSGCLPRSGPARCVDVVSRTFNIQAGGDRSDGPRLSDDARNIRCALFEGVDAQRIGIASPPQFFDRQCFEFCCFFHLQISGKNFF